MIKFVIVNEVHQVYQYEVEADNIEHASLLWEDGHGTLIGQEEKEHYFVRDADSFLGRNKEAQQTV